MASDFGESFVQRERYNRQRKSVHGSDGQAPSRARSEIGDLARHYQARAARPILDAFRSHSRGAMGGGMGPQNPAATAQLNTSFRSEASGGSILHYGRFPSSETERNGAGTRSIYDTSHLASSIGGGGSRTFRNRPGDWCEVMGGVVGGSGRRQPPCEQPTINDDYGEVDEEPESEEEEGEEELADDDDSREEMSAYNFHSGSTAQASASNSQRVSLLPHQPVARTFTSSGKGGSAANIDQELLYYFGVIRLLPDRVRHILATHPPPREYASLSPIEKAGYLFYYTLYRKWLSPVSSFHAVFNREFYKYKCERDSDDVALLKICKHTEEEFKRRVLEQKKKNYHLSQRHLFSDERETPDSRNSDRPSYGPADAASDDLNSVDSSTPLNREPLLFRVPHAPISFAVGGRLIYLNPSSSVSTVRLEDAKSLLQLDSANRRNVEAIECFKGPLLAGETPTHGPLLFIQRQIERILVSDVYRGNPTSSDANDCLLIWHLLETLVRQHGKVTGPDLARLLIPNVAGSFGYSQFQQPPQTGSKSKRSSNGQPTMSLRDERRIDAGAMDRFTRFLLGGYVDEAIESAMGDGLLFDALLMAHRMYRNDKRKLDEVEAKLLRSFRPSQHPMVTLMSVAAETPVPLLIGDGGNAGDLEGIDGGGGEGVKGGLPIIATKRVPLAFPFSASQSIPDGAHNGWRVHAAIVLANLQTQTAISTIYELGLTLAQKDFHSAADFCFLVVNLLTGHDCFREPLDGVVSTEGGELRQQRRHIRLINASLPDDEMHSTVTRFGWSILDLQATELYDYATKLATGAAQQTALSRSWEYLKCRWEYAQLLSELGGLNTNCMQYLGEITRSVWDQIDARGQEESVWLGEMLVLYERYIGFMQQSAPPQSLEIYQALKARLGTATNQHVTGVQSTATTHVPAKSEKKHDRRDTNEAKAPRSRHQQAAVAPLIEPSTLNPKTESLRRPTLESTKSGSIDNPPVGMEQSRAAEALKQSSGESIPRTQHARHQSPKNKESNSSSPPQSATFDSEATSRELRSASMSSRTSVDYAAVASQPSQPPQPYQQAPYNYQQQTAAMTDEFAANSFLSDDYSSIESPFSVAAQPELPFVSASEQAAGGADSLEGSARKSTVKNRYFQDDDDDHLRINGQPSMSAPVGGKAQALNQQAAPTSQPAGGIFGGLKAKIAKMMPDSSAMKLPDDKNPGIVWNEELKCYLNSDGSRLGEELNLPPPPTTATQVPSSTLTRGEAPSMTTDTTSALDPHFHHPQIPLIPMPNPATGTVASGGTKAGVGAAPVRQKKLTSRYQNVGMFS